ncbi:hypothetical protein [Methylobacterium organophilum]|uniref:Uncharacterized protein n=1 Tax=Methylobacterium organophilum TaxID=410 RepID=A0ABQ4T850_METOR|nr:hypothetical protein [Methylobacterium organophilum]GJE27855.1 hypothetical protein LKMONMHP_2717 [Methylobacterium organophilum]
MTIRNTILAAILALAGSLSAADAAEIRAVQAGSVDLGTLSGVAYYTPEAKGYRVVVTLAPRAAAPAVRFETVLAADQSVTFSTPRAEGNAAEAVEISRVGDRVRVSRPGQDVVKEAAAIN